MSRYVSPDHPFSSISGPKTNQLRQVVVSFRTWRKVGSVWSSNKTPDTWACHLSHSASSNTAQESKCDHRPYRTLFGWWGYLYCWFPQLVQHTKMQHFAPFHMNRLILFWSIYFCLSWLIKHSPVDLTWKSTLERSFSCDAKRAIDIRDWCHERLAAYQYVTILCWLRHLQK